MEKLNVPCVVQEIETPLGIVRVTDRTGKPIPMHVCRNGVDIDYPIPGTEENLQEVPAPSCALSAVISGISTVSSLPESSVILSSSAVFFSEASTRPGTSC